MALRVLPSLALAVTEPTVRKRKRLVMLAPGFVAFAVYRVLKRTTPLEEPLALLLVSGLCAAVTALWAYGQGRVLPIAKVWKEDGPRRLTWLVGWIGFVYGVQLSLLVLALLKIVVGYDFLQHPDGPAMMAMVIACTSVGRDAFEIGHIHSLQRRGDPVFTFPDGVMLRSWARHRPGLSLQWTLLGALITGLAAGVVALGGEVGRSAFAQLCVVTLMAASLALPAYLAGEQRPGGWRSRLAAAAWKELARFWWWPGAAFAATYDLVVLGALSFGLRWDGPLTVAQSATVASLIGGLVALYCCYLGHRRVVEDQVRAAVPATLLRCPFVLGILTKARSAAAPMASAADAVLGQVPRR
jgi:hypothetical protein